MSETNGGGSGAALGARVRDLPELLTPRQAADAMQVTTRQIAKMCERGDLRAVRVGRLWRVNRDALAASLGI